MSGWSSSGWPSPDRADDERLARSLAAGGDAEALIQLLDRYAARLFDYCHALLRDQESAAGALHDAILAAYAHAGRLHDHDRFRGWLYTLVRNECMRRLRDPARPTERYEAPEVEDMFLDAGDRAQRLETRRLVHNALSGLRGRERESLDLLLRHGLDTAEIGGVLGIDAREADELAGEARHRLDDALAAVIIARTGREDCPTVGAIAQDGEWPLPQAVARKLIRHIHTCATCTERRHRTVSTAGLLQALPVALMPADLRGRILATATDPAFAGALMAIAQRAEPFDSWGWPVPADHQGGGHEDDRRRPGAPRLWPAVAAAAAVIVLAVGAFIVIPGSSEDRTSAQTPTGRPSSPDPSQSAADPSESPSESPTPTPTTTSPTPTPRVTRPTPTPTRKSPTPTPTRSSKPPARGTLSVTGCTVPASGASCPITVRAVGGPVTWSVVGRSGGVSAGGGGTLGAGRTTTVTASRPEQCGAGAGSVSFAPSGSAPVSWTCGDGNGGGDGGGGGQGR